MPPTTPSRPPHPPLAGAAADHPRRPARGPRGPGPGSRPAPGPPPCSAGTSWPSRTTTSVRRCRHAVKDRTSSPPASRRRTLRLPSATYLACLSPDRRADGPRRPVRPGRRAARRGGAERRRSARPGRRTGRARLPRPGEPSHHGARPPTAGRRGGWSPATCPAGTPSCSAPTSGRDQAAIGQLVALQVVVGLIVLVVLGVAGYLLVRNSLRPLAEVERTAGRSRPATCPSGCPRATTGPRSAGCRRRSTACSSRIERAFRAQQASEAQARGSEDRMRRFVADASHELRTPLTSIRGFAELYRQGAVRTEDDVRRLMGRIETEGARMGMLVEDLLLLARLDQQRPLTIGPVDLAAIAGDAVHDARAVQPSRPIALHLDESLADVPVVQGDEARLRQVVGNLVTNALTHTPPDTRVSGLGGRRGRRPRRPGAAGGRRGAGHGRRPTPTGPSSASTGWTPPGRGRPAGPASDWPSSPPWWPRTAGRWTWSPRPARARPSPSGCRAAGRPRAPPAGGGGEPGLAALPRSEGDDRGRRDPRRRRADGRRGRAGPRDARAGRGLRGHDRRTPPSCGRPRNRCAG